MKDAQLPVNYNTESRWHTRSWLKHLYAGGSGKAMVCIVPGIVAVLILQFLTALFVIYNVGFETLFSRDALLLITGIGLLIGLLQLPIKSLLKLNHINGQKLAELKKWKMDAGLFLSQWENEQTVDTTIWENVDSLLSNLKRSNKKVL